MKKQKFIIKDEKIKKLLRKGGRKGAKKDFFELLSRAVNSNTIILDQKNNRN